MKTIAICIATCKRPVFLGNLLKSLSRQTFRKNQDIDVKIFIVDNDPKGSAESVAKQWTLNNIWPVIYEVEKRRGIPFARNRLVKLAGAVDFIVFIDDDEVAQSNWLDELLFVQKGYLADVVAGPVLAKFETPPPGWITRGQFFFRPRRKTGEKVKYVGSGNVLIRAALFSGLQGPFEENLGLQGGEDTLLFSKLHQQLGACMVWAENAVVKESISPSRVRASWLIKRAYRSGIALAINESYLAAPFSAWQLKRMVKGVGNIVRGFGLLAPAIFRGKAAMVWAMCYLAKGIGSISGLLGLKYNEYQTIHGE